MNDRVENGRKNVFPPCLFDPAQVYDLVILSKRLMGVGERDLTGRDGGPQGRMRCLLRWRGGERDPSSRRPLAPGSRNEIPRPLSRRCRWSKCVWRGLFKLSSGGEKKREEVEEEARLLFSALSLSKNQTPPKKSTSSGKPAKESVRDRGHRASGEKDQITHSAFT